MFLPSNIIFLLLSVFPVAVFSLSKPLIKFTDNRNKEGYIEIYFDHTQILLQPAVISKNECETFMFKKMEQEKVEFEIDNYDNRKHTIFYISTQKGVFEAVDNFKNPAFRLIIFPENCKLSGFLYTPIQNYRFGHGYPLTSENIFWLKPLEKIHTNMAQDATIENAWTVIEGIDDTKKFPEIFSAYPIEAIQSFEINTDAFDPEISKSISFKLPGGVHEVFNYRTHRVSPSGNKTWFGADDDNEHPYDTAIISYSEKTGNTYGEIIVNEKLYFIDNIEGKNWVISSEKANLQVSGPTGDDVIHSIAPGNQEQENI